MREDERGASNPIGKFKNGARVGGIKVPTGEGFLPVAFLGKMGEAANLIDSSLIEKRVERPPLLRGSTKSSFTRDLRASVSIFPYLKPTAIAWPGGGGLNHERLAD